MHDCNFYIICGLTIPQIAPDRSRTGLLSAFKMAPKRSLDRSSTQAEHDAKRSKLSPSLDGEQPVFKQSTPLSRSETPAEMSTSKVEFTVVYPATTISSKKKLDRNKLAVNERLLNTAEYQESPFKAKGARVDGELDQHYTVLPAKKWGDMKKYNNFISRFDNCMMV